MSWDYAIQAGPSGSLEALTDYLEPTSLRIIPESGADLRTVDVTIPHKPGRSEDVVEFYGVGAFTIKGRIRDTDSAGAVTHINGRPGHLQANLSAIRRLFVATRAPVIIQRTLPDAGDVQIRIRPGLPATGTGGGSQNEIFIPCTAVWPFWRSTTEQSTTGTSVAVGGDAPISDMILEFSGAGRWTHQASGDYVEILGGGATIVDVGAGTILTNPGGADNSINFVTNVPWWQLWEPGTVTLTKTVGGTIRWRDSYR